MSVKTQNKEIYWSRFASDFEKRNNYVVGELDLTKLKEHLSKEINLGKALELGCGDGAFSKVIATNATKLIATDWSKDMVTMATSKLSHIDWVTVQQENCFDLSFADNSFDTVFMANLLHIIPTPEKALRECKRVMKPNGKLIILSFTMHGMGAFAKIGMLYRYLRTYGKPPEQSRVLTPENVGSMLNAEGLSVLDVSLMGKKMKAVYAKAKNLEI